MKSSSCPIKAIHGFYRPAIRKLRSPNPSHFQQLSAADNGGTSLYRVSSRPDFEYSGQELAKSGLLTILLAFVWTGGHAAEKWRVDPSQSTLTFEAIQQDAAFTGHFLQFAADIQLDPNAPDLALKIDAEIDMSAVDTANDERDDYLMSKEFFHSKRHRKAKFETTNVSTQGDQLVALGNLTIKKKTRPVEMEFHYDHATRRLTGTTEISRLEFNIGTGMWTDTTWIADEVRVNIDVVLQAAP